MTVVNSLQDLSLYDDTEEESIESQIEERFLTPSVQLNEDWLHRLQPDIKFSSTDLAAHVGEFPAFEPRIRLGFQRKGLSGEISKLEIGSVTYSELVNPTSALSVTRRAGRKQESVKGNSGGIPFTPGGIDIIERSLAKDLHHSDLGLLDTPPGISRGAVFTTMGDKETLINENEEFSQIGSDGKNKEHVIEHSNLEVDIGQESLKESQFSSIDDLLPESMPFVRDVIKEECEAVSEGRNWAHMVDINQKMENFKDLVPNPARTWPFELDNFQKEAIYRLEQGDSVFVAAHTSAGKTVVAEYAMSMATQHMTKCIYTSPIKALSNQKYRDFKQEYDDVGILTGDVQLNPDATTLIMTTEILRSMLYRGADIIRDVEFIIFDEVHYVNDSERGVVWEEVIIMLPEHVKLILLSATVPNTFEFANWVGRTKQKDVYVISTSKRPVPLSHSLYVENELFPIVDAQGSFNNKGYLAAQNKATGGDRKEEPKTVKNTSGGNSNLNTAIKQKGRASKGENVAKGMKKQLAQITPQKSKANKSTPMKTRLLHLADYLRKNQLLPTVFFVFSRKMCESHAMDMQSTQLNTGKEQSQVHMFMEQAISRLRKEDRDIPQITFLREMLKNGIGVHHSGLLPIMKEVVEILFARGLVKILFATETFAMGLNLPTRTVVFTDIRKFDSKVMRLLNPSEYTQMAGRAGRRGLDTVGTVIIMNTSKTGVTERYQLERMILGKAKKLSSQFRLTYQMILSLLRIEAVRVEDVIHQSFGENESQSMKPQQQQIILNLQQKQVAQKNALSACFANDGSSYATLLVNYHVLEYEYQKLGSSLYRIFGSEKGRTRMKNKYVVYARGKKNSEPLSLGIIANIYNFGPYIEPLCYIRNSKEGTRFWPIDRTTLVSPQKRMRPYRAGWDDILFVSDLGWPSQLGDDSMPSKDVEEAIKFVKNKMDSFQKEVNVSKLTGIDAQVILEKRALVSSQMRDMSTQLENNSNFSNQKHSLTTLDSLHVQARDITEIQMQLKDLENSGADSAALLPEYEQRINLLKEAGYIDEQLNVAMKGRVACEISIGFELYITELIMDNFLSSFEPEEIVALLSAFVFEGGKGVESTTSVTPKLDLGRERILDIFEFVNGLADANNVMLTQEESEFAEKDRFGLMHVIYEWARGMSFSEITSITNVQEGLIVRVINRLDEVCRSVMTAARIIGEVELYDKLAIAQEKIKRDIVFCSSLYL